MRRIFDQADLRLAVLQLIAEQPRHGYDIIKDIEGRFSGSYAPSPGVIYPLLTMLEEQGVVSMRAGEGSKKLYAITPEGEAELAANKPAVDAVFARIKAMGERFSHARPAEVVRAFENLKFALRLRTERGLDETQARAVAAALDAAAQAVERS
jgi:DNA-binding PadR family transcriptional regulator